MAKIKTVSKRIHLWRVSSSAGGTVGWIDIDGIPGTVAYTLEQPWNDNQRDNRETAGDESSCIPPGTYLAQVEKHAHWPHVVRLYNVPGRSGVLVHSGNTIADSIGCILVGDCANIQHLIQFPSLSRSRSTLAKLCALVGGGQHTLTVHSVAESKSRGYA